MTKDELQKLKATAVQVHANAVRHGFWDVKPAWETVLMLIITELSEAVQADRKGRYADLAMFEHYSPGPLDSRESGEPDFNACFEGFVKDTTEDELADAVIRMLDTLEEYAPLWHKEINPISQLTEWWKTPNFGTLPELCFTVTSHIVYNSNPTRSPSMVFLTCVEILKRYFEVHNIDLWRHVELKMKYNESRPIRHGKSY